jgi:hypothetical protein
LEIAALCAALLVAIFAFCAWIASRDEQQRLQTTLTAQKQIINAAGVRERDRDASLKIALAQINKLKRETRTPSQIIHDLPKYLPLPQPITFVDAPNLSETETHHGMDASEKDTVSQIVALSPLDRPPVAPEAQVPAADLKSLYDFVQDYRACQLRLTAANQNAFDQTGNVAALTRERDVAIAAAKGG